MFFISLLTFTKSPALLPISKACSDLPGHRDITAHSHTGLGKLSWSFSEAERDSSLELPRGSEFQAAVGPCPAASSVWRGPEGQRQGSLWQWIICLSVTVPAGRDAQDYVGVSVCVHMKYIYAGFCFKHIFVSQGLIFICCVSTRSQCSAEMLTQVILACPFKDIAP